MVSTERSSYLNKPAAFSCRSGLFKFLSPFSANQALKGLDLCSNDKENSRHFPVKAIPRLNISKHHKCSIYTVLNGLTERTPETMKYLLNLKV